MKVLMVNKFFYIKGGSETYYFALKSKLEQEGHKVIDFSMKDPRNYISPYAKYFVENIDYSKEESLILKIKMALNIVYSREAKRKFEELVIKEKPDIVHLHIFQHQLSPSILEVCKKYNIPTVYTAHDLKMVCLNYKMMHHGHICEDCKCGKFYHCTLNRCVKNSFAKSCVNTVEGYFHKWRRTYDAIDYIITPSNFYKKKLGEFGIELNRIIHIPNFLNREKPAVKKKDDAEQYLLYFGRLSEEKGIITLIRAMQKINFNLYIVGTGPMELYIRNFIKNMEMKNISLLGFKTGQELSDIVGNAAAIVLPSEWYENGPYSAIEALQLGKPIIGADIGGIPELVKDNGILFEAGNTDDLEKAIKRFLNDGDEHYLQEERSLKLFEEEYTWDNHKRLLYGVYRKAIEKHESNKLDKENKAQ